MPYKTRRKKKRSPAASRKAAALAAAATRRRKKEEALAMAALEAEKENGNGRASEEVEEEDEEENQSVDQETEKTEIDHAHTVTTVPISETPVLKVVPVVDVAENVSQPHPVPEFDDGLSAVGDEEDFAAILYQESLIFEKPPSKPWGSEEISVEVDFQKLKDVEDDFEGHAVYFHFASKEFAGSKSAARDWIHKALEDNNAGSIRYMRYLGRGFFMVYFEQVLGKRKALDLLPNQRGADVNVFPWCAATVNPKGQMCTPRIIVLPGLPDQYLPLLPWIGRALGAFVGCVGVVDASADMADVRCQEGWGACYNVSELTENSCPRIVVMLPPDYKLPCYIKLPISKGGPVKRQPLFEQLPGMVPTKRKAASLSPEATCGFTIKKLRT